MTTDKVAARIHEHAPLTHLADDPERYYTYGGKVAHLIAYGTDLGSFPYTPAYCGHEPQWPSKWLGSGTQDEYDLAHRLPICKRCMKQADETREFVDGLKADLDAWKAAAARGDDE